jgi:hypothetical protein
MYIHIDQRIKIDRMMTKRLWYIVWVNKKELGTVEICVILKVDELGRCPRVTLSSIIMHAWVMLSYYAPFIPSLMLTRSAHSTISLNYIKSHQLYVLTCVSIGTLYMHIMPNSSQLQLA